jgi:predicted nuclease of predicted toxin-antitoxin system
MRFLADENIDRRLVAQLREFGHVVVQTAESHAGLGDAAVLRLAFDSDAALITEDKGFGELVLARNLPCRGLVLLRLNELTRTEAVQLAAATIDALSERLLGHVTVIQPAVVRSRPLSRDDAVGGP